MQKVLRYMLAAICLVLSGVIGSTVIVLNSLASVHIDEPPVTLTPPMVNSKINVLLLGADGGVLEGGKKGPMRTDTMMVASFDPLTYEIKVISIPRDSRVEIPGRKNLDKINAAHAYGGIQLAVSTVELLLDVPIHYYVRIEHDGFRRVIDAIGGIDYFVEQDMFYEDPYQDLFINLKKGQQRLDGDKAEQYVRFRGSEGDISRIKRQQKFLIATLKTMLRPANLMRVNSIVDIALKCVRTNVDSAVILRYLPLLDKISDQRVVMMMLPGHDGWINGGSYWLVDRAEMDKMLKEHFWDELQGEPETVSVKVQDASGKGLGQQVAAVLSRRGFSIAAVEALPETKERTKITAHHSNDVAGHMIYRVLRQGQLYSEKVTRDVDVTIVIGKDFSR